MGKKVTIADVAKLAGVSLSTVSYAVSGARPIRAETRERVEKAMADLDYKPNANARSLAARRSSVISLVYPGLESPLGETLTGFVRSAAMQARYRGYTLVLWPNTRDEEWLIRDMADQQMADGVLLLEVDLFDPRVTALSEGQVPFVLIGRTQNLEGLHSVDIDFEQTVDRAMSMLRGLGHRRIGLINQSEKGYKRGYAPTHRVLARYNESMADAGEKPYAALLDESPLAGRDFARQVLHEAADLTAFLTMNEMATIGFSAEFQHLGVRIPQDVSVVELVTSQDVAQMTQPTLTYYEAPSAEEGALAADQLIDLIEGIEVAEKNRLIQCPLVPGDSVAMVRQGPFRSAERNT